MSAVYYPTSLIIMHSILQIASYFKNYENDIVLREAIVAMKTKYLKYWRAIIFLYAFAFILDLRAKINGFANVLDLISNDTELNYSNYFVDVCSRLHGIF